MHTTEFFSADLSAAVANEYACAVVTAKIAPMLLLSVFSISTRKWQMFCNYYSMHIQSMAEL